jgi:heme/copper-type cytochrome/quinol oxidase subunit 2
MLTVVFGILEPLFVKYKQSMGFLVPATDTMAAILSLYMEVFAYGIFILLLVTYCIDVCITEYSAECSAWDVEHDSIYVEYLRDITRTYAQSRHWNSRPENAWFVSTYADGSTYWRHTPEHTVAQAATNAKPHRKFTDEEVNDLYTLAWSGFYPSYFSRRAESFLDICFLLFPTTVVVCLLIPTLGFLYGVDSRPCEALFMSIDVIGHQWYWSYEYCLGNGDNDLCFDSVLDVDAVVNRNLEVDNAVIIPTGAKIGLSFTSTDVIHSWAVPQLGVKVDAVPGRLSNVSINTFADGVYYGQCSELCGVMHGFMPICVESVPTICFFMWSVHFLEYSTYEHVGVYYGEYGMAIKSDNQWYIWMTLKD